MEQQMEDGVVVRMEGIAVGDLRRHNKYVAVGDMEGSIVDVMLAVSGHHDIQFIEIVGMNGRVYEALVVKICLNQLLRLENLVIGVML